MRKISLRLSDAEYERLEMFRGEKSISEYIRTLISANDDKVKNEAGDFQKLFVDVAHIREILTKNPTKHKDLLALATFMAEVASIANPPAYANHRDKIQELYEAMISTMQREG